VTYKTAILKRNIEAVLMYPFVFLGKIMSPFFSLQTKHKVFIFSPSADIGGSIQVNVDLCSCMANETPLVIFSKKPKNNEFQSQFNLSGARTIDLHKYVDNKAFHFVNFFYRGVISSWINKAESPVVIGGESLFFYKVLPHIKKNAMRADICHLNTWFNYSQAFIKDLDARIFSTPTLKRQMEALYNKNNLALEFYDRLHFIDNKVNIPEPFFKINEKLLVVFIGRGAPQKRVHIIVTIAKRMHDMKMNIHFSFVGDVEKIINPADYPYCSFYGNIKDKNKMGEIYKDNDVLLLTSSNEGLPIAVMEMMAFGKVVVSTAVGGIPDYITTGENGFLLENNANEDKIIEEGIQVLNILSSNKSLLHAVGKNSRLYAEKHFSGKAFCENYKNVLLCE
jgi:glycosyltransferase involved in cell wall biosynthesis